MTIDEAVRSFVKMQQRKDVDGIDNLLREYPALLADRATQAELTIRAAMFDETPELIHILYRHGVPLDISPDNDPIQRPLYAAASTERWATMRWLIEHGAEVNWEVPGKQPYCVPMATVIRSGQLDIVKLLVEAGAFMNVLDRRGRTPLDWAVAYGQAEIAEFLSTRR